MAKRASDTAKLLKLIRRILVLAVAAWGLAREMPYTVLLARLAVLWMVLSLSSLFLEAVLQRMSLAAARRAAENQMEDDSTENRSLTRPA